MREGLVLFLPPMGDEEASRGSAGGEARVTEGGSTLEGREEEKKGRREEGKKRWRV